jgi:GxxExxY protein
MELRKADLHVDAEKEVVIRYEGQEVGRHRLDILVEDTVLVGLKAVADLAPAHYEQVRSYLRATNLEVALLINFGRERSDVRRIDLPPSPLP